MAFMYLCNRSLSCLFSTPSARQKDSIKQPSFDLGNLQRIYAVIDSRYQSSRRKCSALHTFILAGSLGASVMYSPGGKPRPVEEAPKRTVSRRTHRDHVPHVPTSLAYLRFRRIDHGLISRPKMDLYQARRPLKSPSGGQQAFSTLHKACLASHYYSRGSLDPCPNLALLQWLSRASILHSEYEILYAPGSERDLACRRLHR